MIYIYGDYFDGKSSQKKEATIAIDESDIVNITTKDLSIKLSLKDLRFSSRVANTPREIILHDGSTIYSSENDKIDKLIKRSKKRSNLIHILESKMRYAFLSLILVIVVLFFFFGRGSDLVADKIAEITPYSIEKKLSDETLKLLDNYILLKSKLPQKERKRVKDIFKKLTNNEQRYKLHLRRGVGENAFALPSGDIVITDELVTFSRGDDDMIFGVLAHEMGHIKHKHSIKILIKYSLTTALISYITGDISTFVSILGTSALNANYSREYESQADRYAKNRMLKEGVDPKHLADFFIKLKEKNPKNPKNSYFSSHPSNKERIDYLLTKD